MKQHKPECNCALCAYRRIYDAWRSTVIHVLWFRAGCPEVQR